MLERNIINSIRKNHNYLLAIIPELICHNNNPTKPHNPNPRLPNRLNCRKTPIIPNSYQFKNIFQYHTPFPPQISQPSTKNHRSRTSQASSPANTINWNLWRVFRAWGRLSLNPSIIFWALWLRSGWMLIKVIDWRSAGVGWGIFIVKCLFWRLMCCCLGKRWKH